MKIKVTKSVKKGYVTIITGNIKCFTVDKAKLEEFLKDSSMNTIDLEVLKEEIRK